MKQTLHLFSALLTLGAMPLLNGLPGAAPASAQAPKPDTAASEASAQDEARRKQAVVTGNGISITVGDLEDVISKQPAILRRRYLDPDQLKALAQNLLRVELIAAEAERRGYGDNPVVQRTVKDSAVQSLIRLEIDTKITPESITEEDVKAYYEAHYDDFHRPALRRASQILVASEEAAKQVLTEATEADARRFSQLAKEHSLDEETKLRGGDLGYFAREPAEREAEATNIPEAVRKAAFSLKTVGDITPEPVAVGDQFAIVRLIGERPERHTELAQAENAIRSRMWRKRRQEALTNLIAELRAKHKPQVFADRVEAISFEGLERRTGGFPPDPVKGHPPAGHSGSAAAHAGH